MSKPTYGSPQPARFPGQRATSRSTITLGARISGVSKSQDGYIKRYDYGCLFPNSGIPALMTSRSNCVLDKESEVNYQGARGCCAGTTMAR